MIIPIGVDCGLAEFIKTHRLRSFSFPFDWVVSYNGVSNVFKNNFKDFIPNYSKKINQYDIYFAHDFTDETFEVDKIKYNRRIQRLQQILETSNEPIIFFRKGHAPHHHHEHNGKFTSIKSDLIDAEELDHHLSEKYPLLNYKIIVVLACGVCFDCNHPYKSLSNKIEIHNIAREKVDDPLFTECIAKIYNVA
jgi:hypothetical protein